MALCALREEDIYKQDAYVRELGLLSRHIQL